MADTKLITLVQRLSQKTVEGKIAWEQTVDEGVFQAAFSGYTVRIFSQPTKLPGRSGIDYILQILNEEGVLIEEVSDLDFRGMELDPTAYELMKDIHDLARRKAMGVDKALDVLLTELED